MQGGVRAHGRFAQRGAAVWPLLGCAAVAPMLVARAGTRLGHVRVRVGRLVVAGLTGHICCVYSRYRVHVRVESRDLYHCVYLANTIMWI